MLILEFVQGAAAAATVCAALQQMGTQRSIPCMHEDQAPENIKEGPDTAHWQEGWADYTASGQQTLSSHCTIPRGRPPPAHVLQCRSRTLDVAEETCQPADALRSAEAGALNHAGPTARQSRCCQAPDLPLGEWRSLRCDSPKFAILLSAYCQPSPEACALKGTVETINLPSMHIYAQDQTRKDAQIPIGESIDLQQWFKEDGTTVQRVKRDHAVPNDRQTLSATRAFIKRFVKLT